MTEAEEKNDWDIYRKALSIKDRLDHRGAFEFRVITPFILLDSFLAAWNQETAGQYAPAVISYQLALRVPSDSVPVKIIAEHLAAIQRDHPKEYEEGMQLYLDRYKPPIPQ